MMQTASKYANAAIGHNEKVLQDIHLKSKNIAVYQRDIESLRQDLVHVAKRTLECRASGTATEVLSVLQDFFKHDLPQCTALLEDISETLRLFVRITQASSFRLMLTTVSTNMCSRFHTDINDLRLLCTYIGPGTLWLPDEAIDHKASRTRSNNQELVIDEQQIQQVSAGDIVILKGALFPEAKPILHQSPAIEQIGGKRLLLRIDTDEFLNFLT